jgi:hypothetical protein
MGTQGTEAKATNDHCDGYRRPRKRCPRQRLTQESKLILSATQLAFCKKADDTVGNHINSLKRFDWPLDERGNQTHTQHKRNKHPRRLLVSSLHRIKLIKF